VHRSHKGKVHFDHSRRFSDFAGPHQCRLCGRHRDALVDSRVRKRDHFVRDAFDSEIDLDNFEDASTLNARPPTRTGNRYDEDDRERGPVRVFSKAKLCHPRRQFSPSSFALRLDRAIHGVEEADEDQKIRPRGRL
jgi:hypothetical protein